MVPNIITNDGRVHITRHGTRGVGAITDFLLWYGNIAYLKLLNAEFIAGRLTANTPMFKVERGFILDFIQSKLSSCLAGEHKATARTKVQKSFAGYCIA